MWIFFTMIIYIVQIYIFHVAKKDLSFFQETGYSKETIALFFIQVVTLFFAYSVYVAIAINHTTHCEMLIFTVQEIRTRLEEKSITLKEAMQVYFKLCSIFNCCIYFYLFSKCNCIYNFLSKY